MPKLELDDVINTLEQIQENVERFEEIYNRKMRNFWPTLGYPDDPFFQPSGSGEYSKTLVISGPSRNGNHLVHSLLDNHPNLPRIPGEDATIPVIIPEIAKNPFEMKRELTSEDCIDYLLTKPGEVRDWKIQNKWEAHFQRAKEGINETETWSGVYQRENLKANIFDYQDTISDIDYPSYKAFLEGKKDEIINANHIYDILDIFLGALSRLDPEYKKRRENLEYPLIAFGSGMREELFYMMNCSERVKAITPIRPFGTYFYSFTRSYHGVNEVSPWLLKEGWEHWYHKVTDYVILKRLFPEKVCLVQFEHLIKNNEGTIREILRFLDVPFHENCLEPTVLGELTKGNSGEGKSEEYRGEIYSNGIKKRLDEGYIPDVYDEFWDAVQALCI